MADLLPFIMHERELLEKVEMLDTGISFGIEAWGMENEEFNISLNRGVTLIRKLSKRIQGQ